MLSRLINLIKSLNNPEVMFKDNFTSVTCNDIANGTQPEICLNTEVVNKAVEEWELSFLDSYNTEKEWDSFLNSNDHQVDYL